MDFSKALSELRKKNKKRNFDQTVDLIINLRDFDPRRETANTSVILSHLNIRKKVCGFLENESKELDYAITKAEIERLKPDEVKKMAKNYDFFIASAKLMPTIAAKFGKILGIMGKMPDPKMGCVLMSESEPAIKEIVSRLHKTVKIRAKESSIKTAIAKESMPDNEIEENARAVLKAVTEALPKKEFNIRSVMLKFTMSHPVKIKKEK